MRILFDQGTPAPLSAFLPDHTVTTARRAGWERLDDRNLLDSAEQAGFDLLLTTDKRMAFQQNLSKRKISVLVLSNSKWLIVRRYVRRIQDAVDASTPGSYRVVEIPLR